jgi:hypothetical protein
MTKLLGPLAKTLFALFVLGVFAGVMYYSFRALGMIFPGDLIGQLFGMVLFDVAALTWFLVFVKESHSTMQYVFSIIGFMVGIVGTLGLVAIEVGISSNQLLPADVAKPLNYIFIAVLIAHLLLTYAYHAAAPAIAADISMGVERARIMARAEKDAEKLLIDNQHLLAEPLAAEHVRRVMQDLNLQKRDAGVIEGRAYDVVEPAQVKSPGAANSFLSGILNGWGGGARKYESSAPSVANTSPPRTQAQSPAAVDAGPGDIGKDTPKA